MRPGVAADLAALDAAISLIWARAAKGEITFETAHGLIDQRAEGICDLSRLASLMSGGATETDVIAAIQMVARRRRSGGVYAPIVDWAYFRGPVADVVRDRLREEEIDREFAAFWAMGWPECESDRAKSRRLFGTLRESVPHQDLMDAVAEAMDRVSAMTRGSVVLIKAGKIIEVCRARRRPHWRGPP